MYIILEQVGTSNIPNHDQRIDKTSFQARAIGAHNLNQCIKNHSYVHVYYEKLKTFLY